MDFMELMESLGELGEIIQAVQGVLTLVGVVVGGLLCFFGYKLFRVMTAIIGFIVGGIIGAIVGGAMAGEGGAFVGLLVLGILGALLAYALYQLGVFIICFGGGAMIGLVLAMLMEEPDAVMPLAAIAGLIVGIIGVLLTKPVLIVSTSAGGGMSMGFALGGLMEDAGMGTVAGVVLAIAGIFVQFYFDRKTGGNENAVAANGATAAANSAPMAAGGIFAANRAPASGYKVGSWAVMKTLTKDDLTSRQAICGAIVFGLLGFALSGCGFMIIIGFMGILYMLFMTLLLAAMGAAMGACWDKGGREFFHMDEADFKNRKTVYGAAIGAAVGVVADMYVAPLVHGHFGVCACLFCTCFLYGAILGYSMGLRGRYQATYGESPNAFRIPAGDSPAPSGRSAPAASFQAAAPAPAQSALVKNDSLLWVPGLPIIVTETSIVPRPENPDLVSLSLAFQNLHDQAVIAVYFGVKCFNRLNQELEPLEKLTVQDFTLESGGSWRCPRPYALPDSDTRRVELVVRHVLMADGSTWDCEEGRTLTAVEEQPPLGLDSVLARQFFQECAGLTGGYQPQYIFKYQPQESEHHWRCACGQINLKDRYHCLVCGIDRQSLFERVDRDYLTQRYQLHQEELRRREEERRQKIEAQKQAVRDARDQAVKTAAQSAAAANSWAKKTWTEKIRPGAAAAKEWSKKAWAEKVWPNRKKILIALCAVVVIAIGAFAIRQYQIQAEAERLRVEQELEEQRRAEERAKAEAEEERRRAEAEAWEQEQRKAMIQEQFEQIISDTTRPYAASDSGYNAYGNSYIDYIDFDNDGQDELLEVYVSNSWYGGGSDASFSLVIYGATEDGHVDLIQSGWVQLLSEGDTDTIEISLAKRDGKTYVKSRIAGSDYLERTSYYEPLSPEILALGDNFLSLDYPYDTEPGVYTDEIVLATLFLDPDARVIVRSWKGVPEVPEEEQWRPPVTYRTAYSEMCVVDGTDYPAFSYIWPDGWSMRGTTADHLEIVKLISSSGATVTFTHRSAETTGETTGETAGETDGEASAASMERIEVSKVADAWFSSSRCVIEGIDYSDLGPFMVAQLKRTGTKDLLEDTDFTEVDGPVAYALLPETMIGTHECPSAPYIENFSFLLGDSISLIAEGDFTEQDMEDILSVLSTFTIYRG